jgi:hypothetical protein
MNDIDRSKTYIPVDLEYIELPVGLFPKAPAIIDDVNANKWVIIDSYIHMGTKYVRAVRIPNIPPTYKIVEVEAGTDT